MKPGSGYHNTNSILPPLRLNKAAPDLSQGLSSYRCTFEKTLRPLFNNPDLTNETFLISLHKLITGFLQYEKDLLPPGSHSITDILIARGLLDANSKRPG